MLRQKRRRDASIATLVGKDTRVHGDLEFSGGCLVDGFVKGNVKAISDENATLSVSERGHIEGTVMVPNVLLNGTVNGDVKAAQRVELGSNARVVGNVQYRLIEMAIGAEINGKLIHETSAGQRTVEEILSAGDADSTESSDLDDGSALAGTSQVAEAN